jgi:2-phospho-L-lactate/phosphoenolpyruvate guanylyltransferase
MSWTALIPLKHEGERKGRLAARLAPDERARLSRIMFDHVVGILSETPGVGRIALLAPIAPEGWPHAWIRDEGRGLNEELTALRTAEISVNLLIIHADLPLLARCDVEAMLKAAARTGVAIAPDRHDSGTNALALGAGAAPRPGFGAGSFERHLLQAPDSPIVRRQGLALDIDTPEDLALAAAAGFDPRPAAGSRYGKERAD